MKIAILGSGAIGSIFGGHLAEAGYDVILIDKWKEHVDKINKDGLHIYGVSGERYIDVKATSSPREIGHVDLIILSVKAYDTSTAIKSCRNIFHRDTRILSIQNGLIPMNEFRIIPEVKHVLKGVTNHGATIIGPGVVYHAGRGPTYIGDPSGRDKDKAMEICDLLNDAGLEAKFIDDIDSVIWSKLVVNIGINALTAISGYKNGVLLEIPELGRLMDEAISEALKIIGRLNIKLMYSDPYLHVREIARKTSNNKSSMLQDIERGRKTEIDYINGAVVRLGEELGIDTPINRVLTYLVKALERKTSIHW